MERINTDWLKNPATQSLLETLSDAGHQAFVVGGAVRNALMGKPVADVDVATSAVPEQVTTLSEAAGFRVIPTGYDHGTVTVVIDDMPFEVTTFRRDVETDGRHAVVAYSQSLSDDASRRDFTMNALYANAQGEVIDPVGGLEDLKEQRVVFVGDAATRIEEDHLRSLRFFRFVAEYGDPNAGLDPDALAAIADHLDGLETLARERIGAEMQKLLSAPDPAPALAAMQATGALLRILPGALTDSVAPLVHLEEAAGVAPDWVRRLAAMGDFDSMDLLRISKKDARRLEAMRGFLASGAGAAEIAWRSGPNLALSVELIRHAALSAPLPADLETAIEKGATANFPVTAADMMPELQGAALGEALSRAERMWIASDFEMDRKTLLDAVAKSG